jgi:hypothetical protein
MKQIIIQSHSLFLGYIDPGSGSFIVQLFLALFSGFVFEFRKRIFAVLSFFKKKVSDLIKKISDLITGETDAFSES